MSLCKQAIITGGSTGIGFALAKILVKNHYGVNLIARNLEKLVTAKEYLEKLKTSPKQPINIYSCDVTDYAATNQTIKQCIAENNCIDLLITVAGDSHPYLFKDTAINNFQNILAVNYFGTVNAIHALMPYFEKQNYGQIVMIASAAALLGIFGHTSYASSKYALRGLAEALYCEYYNSGINVSIAYPPDVDTVAQQRINHIKPWQNKVISAKAGLWQADQLAEYICKKAAKKKFAILPGMQTKLLYYFGSFIKPYLFGYLNKIVKRHQPSN